MDYNNDGAFAQLQNQVDELEKRLNEHTHNRIDAQAVDYNNLLNPVTDATLPFTDITTNNVSSAKHGFVPKTPNSTSKFLRGDGTWASVGLFASGIDASRALNTASGNLVIAHGLGVTPKYLRITALADDSPILNTATVIRSSTGTYNGSSSSYIYHGTGPSGGQDGSSSGTGLVLFIPFNNAMSQQATATFDATNITLAFTYNNGGGAALSWSLHLLWEAFA